MSLFSKVAKLGGKLLKKASPFLSAIPGPIGATAKVVGGITAGFGATRAIGRMAPGAGVMRALPALPGAGNVVRIGRAAGKVAGAAATGAILYDAFGNPVKKKGYRRINPLNHKALNRALKRVCKAKGLADRLNAIEIKSKSKRKTYAC